MNTTPDIFEEREEWKGPLGLSVAFHALLFGSILLYGWFLGSHRGENWGGGGAGGGAISVSLVSQAAIPLPQAQSPTQNVLANESKGVSQSLPKQKAVEEPEAVPIPDRESKVTKRAQTTAQNRPQPVPEPGNVVPYGQGGPATAVPFRMAGGSGGIGVTGPGGGDFGSRYAWYVDKVRRVISDNWFKYEVGPNVPSGARVYLTFEIGRDGRPRNVQIAQSSHIPSLDYSAVNALKRIDTFGPLPADYRGSSVMVEFFFDLSR